MHSESLAELKSRKENFDVTPSPCSGGMTMFQQFVAPNTYNYREELHLTGKRRDQELAIGFLPVPQIHPLSRSSIT
jgi:hypothetical protein